MAARGCWRVTRVFLVAGLAALTVGAGQAGADARYRVERFATLDRREDQVRPRISGDWVVWKDYRGASLRAVDESPNGQIYGRNLSTGQELEIAHTRDAGDPAISGTLVVWTAGGGRTTEIQGVDLLDGNIFSVSAAPGRQERPAVSGPLIVWQDNRNGNWDIFARDLGQNGEFPIVEKKGDQLRPAISGRTVVWEDWRDPSGPDIYALEIDHQQYTRLTHSGDAYEPAIDGRWVVWVGQRDPAVFAHNLDDGRTLRLSSAGGAKHHPAISGELVVWADERNGTRDIYGYDLARGVEIPLVRADADQDDPALDGTTLVWSDARGPNRDIVVARIVPPRETDSGEAAP